LLTPRKGPLVGVEVPAPPALLSPLSWFDGCGEGRRVGKGVGLPGM